MKEKRNLAKKTMKKLKKIINTFKFLKKMLPKKK